MSEKQDESPEIKIVDKRRFNSDGTEREGDSLGSETVPSSDTNQRAEEIENTNESGAYDSQTSFANLILSLAASVQMNLGIAPNPFSHKIEKHLDQAKQTIDLMGMLETKTKGNLSPEEDSLLKVVLSDLRMRYVEEKNKA